MTDVYLSAHGVEQHRSVEKLLQTCRDFNLPEPLIMVDSDEPSAPVTASWLRYDLVIEVLKSGDWRVDDLSNPPPRDLLALSKNQETEWCQMLKSRMESISPGAGPHDMGNREKVPWCPPSLCSEDTMEPAKAEVPWRSESRDSQNTAEPAKAEVPNTDEGEQYNSKERLLQTCRDFNLPEPLISVDIEGTMDSDYCILASI